MSAVLPGPGRVLNLGRGLRHLDGAVNLDVTPAENEFGFYTNRRFERQSTDLVFRPSLVNRVVRRLAARRPNEYEQRWAWMFSAWFLSLELRVRNA